MKTYLNIAFRNIKKSLAYSLLNTGAIATPIALATASFKTFRAARKNPVGALHFE